MSAIIKNLFHNALKNIKSWFSKKTSLAFESMGQESDTLLCDIRNNQNVQHEYPTTIKVIFFYSQVMKEESRCPLGVRYCAILNAVNYISTILRDWGDNVVCMGLCDCSSSRKLCSPLNDELLSRTRAVKSSWVLQVTYSLSMKPELQRNDGNWRLQNVWLLPVCVLQFFLQLQQAAVSLGQQEVLGSLEMTEVGRLASLEGSLFDGLLSLLDRLKGDMLGRLLHFLMRDTAEKAQPYCQERWIC